MQDSAVDIDQALFQPFPSEITFQSYEPHQTYEFPLFLRNLDVVARRIKVTIGKSEYFSVVSKAPLQSKVAPGMEMAYIINFTPNSNEAKFPAIKISHTAFHGMLCFTPIARITLMTWFASLRERNS